jgi:hypothetical protein
MRRKFLIGTALAVSLATTYLLCAKHSIADITAENYMTLLSQDKSKNIFYSGIKNYMYSDYFLSDAHNVVDSTNTYKVLGWIEYEFIESDIAKSIEVTFKDQKVGYTINYDRGTPFGYSVYEYPHDQNSGTVKGFLSKIMQGGDLTIRTSNERSFDILIQETDDSFIIYTVQGHIENPFAIWFQQYHKNKYVNL